MPIKDLRSGFLAVLICVNSLVVLVNTSFAAGSGNTAGKDTGAFTGQDLHLSGKEAVTYKTETDVHILVFQGEFSMSIKANQYKSDRAVIWLLPSRSQGDINYDTVVYLQGNVSSGRFGPEQTLEVGGKSIEQKKQTIVRFGVSGEVFITADTKSVEDPRGLELYTEAFNLLRAVGIELKTTETGLKAQTGRAKPQTVVISTEDMAESSTEKPAETPRVVQDIQLDLKNPFYHSPLGETPYVFEWHEEMKVGTVIGRFYLWQRRDEKGTLLELKADNAVIFMPEEEVETDQKKRGLGDILASGEVEAIYLSGDVVMTEGRRTIRADEIYYDLEQEKALVINAVMRNFDEDAGIPVYIRAQRLKQLAADKFSAENVTLTTSEFYVPQISLNASSISITDTTGGDQGKGPGSKGGFDAQMKDVRLKMYDKTYFYLPYMRSNMQRPDIPLKSMHIGNDNTFGTYLETRWYLARLLGLEEPEGTDSTLALDYYGDRGFGGGISTEYERENYFGRLLGYIINDRGEDRLGRNSSRKNLDPPRELRGRFRWQHRHFLPYSWQLTTEVSYISDKNFIESYYRDEFYVDKGQETLIHLKRIEDNWGLSFFGKVRLNDFVNELEELPTTEFHWAGQSFLDDKLTFYSDSQVSRFRQRYASGSTPIGSQEFFTFMTTRNEVDMPMAIGRTKVVPFVAGTMAFEDGLGFYRELDGATAPREDCVWFGEGGVRVSPQPFWKVFSDVKSELWDINQLRHIIAPHLTAVGYTQGDSVIEQRDTLSVGISQRLQTKRGSGRNRRTVDWMRLDMEVAWVNDSGDSSAGADQFIWNKPFIPLVNEFSDTIPQKDRRGSVIYGPRRNYFEADYLWKVSDTTALLSDMNYDMQGGVVQQYNVGFSHLRWPNLSYYIGSRYLRRIENNYGEKGSNAVTFALTYILDPRYTLVYSGQVDFDYGATVRSDITLIRRYHRLYWSVTFSADESLDRQAVVFSLWPQGVPDLAIGPSRYMGLGGSAGF
jgi:lipopolysaccharide assembly outer membrane protein LptD (OstA)